VNTDWQFKLARALLSQTPNSREALLAALHTLAEAYEAPYAYAITFDDMGKANAVIALSGGDAAERALWERIASLGVVNEALRQDTTYLINDWTAETRRLRGINGATGGIGSVAILSARFEGVLLAAILLLNPEMNRFSTADAAALDNAAALVAAGMWTGYQIENDQEARETQEQLQRDLAAMTYHDLRAPLQNIQTSFAALERFLDSGFTQRDRASELIKMGALSTRRIARMVKSLLDMERLEQGNLTVNRQPVVLNTIIDGALDVLRPLANDADQHLLVEIQGILPTLSADGDMVQRVIINLVENAIKHTPNGGVIRLLAGQDDGSAVRVSVVDSGPGIPPDLRDTIFDKFSRLRGAQGREGVGLGLAFCRLAVEAHGGHIWVDGEPGSGAVFAFTLPLETVSQTKF
jgi:signal transduction histidine kinase